MDDKALIKELNKILTLEHGHLGMYRDFDSYSEKEMRRTLRRFMEIEAEHIEKVRSIIYNLGGKPSVLIESGDIIGQLFGIAINFTNVRETVKAYSFIEKKSHQGYADFVSRVEQDGDRGAQMIAEITSSNMVESKLMHLWLEDKLKTF